MDELSKHFQVLGLATDATLEAATAAYRDLIRVWHPDRFHSDPSLRAKAEEQTRNINQAMAAVREALKNPAPLRPKKAQAKPQPKPPSAAEGFRSTFSTHAISPTLAVHQPKRVCFQQMLVGLLMIPMGWMILNYLVQREPKQAALALVVICYGFSSLLHGLALLCVKRPIISVNRSLVILLGYPAIPLYQLADSRMIISRHGTSLRFSFTPQYLKTVPIPSRLLMRLRYLARRCHKEFRAPELDTHPAHMIDTLDIIARLGYLPISKALKSDGWSAYAHVLATLCLVLAILRCFEPQRMTTSTLLPFLIAFAVLKAISVAKTVIFSPNH